MTRKEIAEEYFLSGYNCAQAVVLAFKDLINIDEKTAAMISSSFGGGIGRQREVCGAISGMVIVLGALKGYSDPKNVTAKKEHYTLIQRLCGKFKEINGSIVCRELLGLSEKSSTPVPEARTSEYYKKRPCKELVGIAAEILNEYLENEKPYCD